MSSWTDLGEGIRVRQSQAYRMNSTVLLDTEHTVLVDPGVLPSEIDDIANLVREAGASQVTLFFTHGDWDHVLGRPWWTGAATVAHDRFASEIRARRDSILEDARRTAAAAGERWERGFEPFRPAREVSGLKFEKVGPWRLVCRDAFGHSASMLSIHLPEHRVLIAADLLSDLEIPSLAQSPDAYRGTLEGLRVLIENGAVQTLIPGHGTIALGPEPALERLTRDLDYLDRLESGVNAAYREGRSLEAIQERLKAIVPALAGADREFVMSMHRDNVRHVHQAVAASAPGTSARSR